ncbi:FG-GAP repeat protein, partial [bacterium]|nr:FG-GAP repeat protein [bacterium]
MRHIVSIILLLFLLANIFAAEELLPSLVLVEPGSSGNFGWSIAGGDFDGDGIDDIAVGAPMTKIYGEPYPRGAVYVYLAGDFSAPAMMINGLSSGDQMGISLDCAGDFNGDGYDDLLAGANVVDHIGAAYIFFGGPDFDDVPDVVFGGENPYDNFGYSSAGLGDINGDGYDDVAVGALYNDERGWRTGRVYIYFGGEVFDTIPDVVLTGLDSLDDFGTCLDGRIDFDGDGIFDLLVGAAQAGGSPPLKPGAAYIFTGDRITIGVEIPEFVFTGEFPMNFFGGTVAGLGDIDGDGFDDIISGAYNYCVDDSCYGRAYIYRGKSGTSSPFEIPDFIITGRNGNDNLGGCVGAVGDVDNDGFCDFAVSADYDPETDTYPGEVLIFRGSAHPDTICDYFCRADTSDGNFGWSIEKLGDITADGFSDFAVGSPDYHDTGKVFIYAGFYTISPVNADVVLPFYDAITSDSLQRTVFAIFSERIIDANTIVIVADDDTFHWDDGTITFEDDTIVFSPAVPYGDGDTVHICLVDVRTTVDDPLSDVVCTRFLVDLSPPVVVLSVPDDSAVVNFRRKLCAWLVIDSVSGRISTSHRAVVSGETIATNMFTYGKFASVWTNPDSAPLSEPNLPYEICLQNLCDDPDYGIPNCADDFCATITFRRRWMAAIAAKVNGKAATNLVIGQMNGASAGYDPACDLLMLPPEPSASDVRLGTFSEYMERNFQSETAETCVWHITNLDTASALVWWDFMQFPDGAFLWNDSFDIFILDSAVIPPSAEATITAIYETPKIFNLKVQPDWNLVGLPSQSAYNNVDDLSKISAIGA